MSAPRIVAAMSMAVLGLTGQAAEAAPVEFDTQGAHVVVVRPIDVWSADKSRAEDSLDVVRSKRANYWVSTARYEALYGGPVLLHRMSDDPLVNSVKGQLEALGFSLATTQDYRFRVELPIEVPPSDYEALRAQQAEVLRAVVLAQGDPSSLRSRTSRGKCLGGLASIATLGVLGKVGGAGAAGGYVNSGIIGDVYQVNQVGPASVPVRLPALDAPSFFKIEIRRVSFFGGMIGQIVVAYRSEKTPELELEALSKAIVSATGADTTPEAIEAARAEDLAWRQGQWDACVAAKECEGATP